MKVSVSITCRSIFRNEAPLIWKHFQMPVLKMISSVHNLLFKRVIFSLLITTLPFPERLKAISKFIDIS